MCRQRSTYKLCSHVTINLIPCQGNPACTKTIERDLKVNGRCPQCFDERTKHTSKGNNTCSDCFVCKLGLEKLISGLTKVLDQQMEEEEELGC